MWQSLALVSLLASTVSSAVTPTFNNPQPARPSPIHIAPPQPPLLSAIEVNDLHYEYDSSANGGPLPKFKKMKSIIAAIPVAFPALAPALFARSPFFGGLGDIVPQALGNLGQALPEWAKPLPPNPKSMRPVTPPGLVNPPAPSPTSSATVPVATARPGDSLVTMNCVNSTGTDRTINSLLFYGGAGQFRLFYR